MFEHSLTNSKTDSKLVLFLYALVKDHLTMGQIEEILDSQAILEMEGERTLANGPAAVFAHDLARQLIGYGTIPAQAPLPLEMP